MKIRKLNFQSNKLCYLLLFLITFVLRVLISLSMPMIKTLMDETNTMAGAAYFAGLDWSAVTSEGSYYGYGFMLFFSFLFKLTDNPFLIFHAMLIVFAILQSIPSFICFYLTKEYWHITDNKVNCLIAVICSYMTQTRAMYISNENILILISWFVCLLLCLLVNVDSKKRKIVILMVLMVLLGYSLLIHTRAITYLMALLATVVLYRLVFKERLTSVGFILILGTMSYIINKKLVVLYVNALWINNIGDVKNTAITIPTVKNLITNGLNREHLAVYFSLFVGQLNTAIIFTGGFAIIAVVVSLVTVRNVIKLNRQKTEDKLNMIVLIYFFICIIITLCGYVWSWGEVVMYLNSIKSVKSDNYGYRAFSYIRYFAPYLGPVTMVVCVRIIKYHEELKKYLFSITVILAVIQLYWMKYVLPYILENSYTHTEFNIYSAWKKGDLLGNGIYYLGILGMSCLFLISTLFYFKNSPLKAMILLCVVLMIQYYYNANYIDVESGKEIYKKINGGYEIIRFLENKIEIPEELYVTDIDGSGKKNTNPHCIYFGYQVLLNRYKILPYEPEEDREIALLFTNNILPYEELLIHGYEYVRLDENEYLLVKGKKIQDEIKKQGVDLLR